VQQVPGSNPLHDRTAPSTQTSPTPSVYAPSTIDVSTFSASSISLAQPAPATAQSARAYIASKGLAVEPKSKTKTRADPSASSEQPKEKKKGFFSRFTRKNQEVVKEKDAEEEGEEAGKKKGVFRSGLRPKLHLPHKAASLIGRLLGGKADEKKGQAGMKWEHFVKVCIVWFDPFAFAREADGETLGNEAAWVSRSQKHGRFQCALRPTQRSGSCTFLLINLGVILIAFAADYFP